MLCFLLKQYITSFNVPTPSCWSNQLFSLLFIFVYYEHNTSLRSMLFYLLWINVGHDFNIYKKEIVMYSVRSLQYCNISGIVFEVLQFHVFFVFFLIISFFWEEGIGWLWSFALISRRSLGGGGGSGGGVKSELITGIEKLKAASIN